MARWKVQLLATIASNPFLLNFFGGKIYKGNLKSVCVPGLNCYSCPAAVGSCPIGALQSVMGSSSFKFSYYIVGTLILFGVMFGRFICGFLCPFGWFQELIHKIPSKKFSTKKLKILTYLKYVILVVFVIVLPITIVNEVSMGNPYFCKYICPSGILQGAIPLSIANESIRASLGVLFTWKSVVLLTLVTASVFFYRPFCKWICPLGAIYALFNRFSVYQLDLNSDKCTKCGACNRVCKMDVDVMKSPNGPECIRCGDCVKICPTNALSKGFCLKKGEIYEKNN